MKKYLVVGFTNEPGNPIEIIPLNWLAKDNACFWPNEKNVKRLKSMIFKCCNPEDTWAQVPIKIYGKSNSIVRAGEKAEQARMISSLDSDSSSEELSQQKRTSRLPIRYRDSSELQDTGSEDLINDMMAKRRKVSKSTTQTSVCTLPKPPAAIVPNEVPLVQTVNQMPTR